MLRHLFFLLCCLLLAALCASGQKYNMPSADGAVSRAVASATIVHPLQLTKVSDMSFGSLTLRGSRSGTVTLHPDGSRSCTAGVAVSGTGVATAASFEAEGAPGHHFTISLPHSIQLIHADDPAHTLQATHFTSFPEQSGTFQPHKTNIQVGATLHLSSSLPAGSYSSEPFEITISYN